LCVVLSCAEPIGSMSSMEVNVDMLEQMDLMDMSDQEAVDVFLHSGGEENSATSPVMGREEYVNIYIYIYIYTVYTGYGWLQWFCIPGEVY